MQDRFSHIHVHVHVSAKIQIVNNFVSKNRERCEAMTSSADTNLQSYLHIYISQNDS